MSKVVAAGASRLVPNKISPVLRPWEEPDWQRLWLATHSLERAWRSLALLPASTGMPVNFIERAAISLSRTGMKHLGQEIHVADATQVRLDQLNDFLAEVAHCTASGSTRVVVALAAREENVTSVAIAQQVDCALLCVLRGYTDAGGMKQTLQDVGKSHFLGAVMFDGLT